MKESISEFFKTKKALQYKKGEVIIRPEDQPAGVYFIEDGYVKIYSITEDGEERLHIIYKPGEAFPLIWALRGIHKELYYEALDNVRLRRASHKEFTEFITSNTDNLRELTERISILFEIFVDRVNNLELIHSYPRLVYRLISLASRLGVKEGNTIVIKAPITHKDIANSVAMSRETASREMEKLKAKGIISSAGHALKINDLKKLESELLKHQERQL